MGHRCLLTEHWVAGNSRYMILYDTRCKVGSAHGIIGRTVLLCAASPMLSNTAHTKIPCASECDYVRAGSTLRM